MVPFTKATACGNDFLIIEERHAPPEIHAFTRRICDRHNGVGADGVEWLSSPADTDAAIRLINADGSEAEISGNGTRCVAAFLVSQGAQGKLAIRTGAGVKHCALISRDRNMFQFEIEMGEPQAGRGLSLSLAGGEVEGMQVSMGNPHFVIFVKEFPPEWQKEGAEIGRRPEFKNGVNVEYVKLAGRHDIEVRFYERGAGETQSSGTGSCASAVAAIAAGHAESPVKVHAPGGTQTVRWSEGRVFLRGPAQLICRGEFLG